MNPDYPPGAWPGDPAAPWNEVDPWEGRTCAECRFCGGVYEDGTLEATAHVCAWAPMTGDGPDVRLLDPHERACESFEAR